MSEHAKTHGPIVSKHGLRDVAMPELVDDEDFQQLLTSSLNAMEQFDPGDGPTISVQTPQIALNYQKPWSVVAQYHQAEADAVRPI